jgi:hypothetical protein
MTPSGERTTRVAWRVFIACVILVAALVGVPLIGIQVSRSTSQSALLTESSFLKLADSAASEKFVATYVVTGTEEIYLFNGTETVAQIPYAPGHKIHFNSEGYAASERYLSYLLHESNGDIVQWIQSGSNVSWCLKLARVDASKLQCTGSSPYIPSNGFAEEAVPYVPTNALSLVERYVEGEPQRNPPVIFRTSPSFGRLRCLLQTSGTPHLTTCINTKGIIVSSFSENGSLWSNVKLLTVNCDPPAKLFKTLLKPSGRVPLPPV